MVMNAYVLGAVVVVTFGAGLAAGVGVQQPRVKAAKNATLLAKAECEVALQEQKAAYLERLVAGERAARSALIQAQEKAQEATREYQQEVARIDGLVNGLPRRISRLCGPQAGPTAGSSGGSQAGDSGAASSGLVHPRDGEPARPDFDARPWRQYAQRCEAVSAGLRACLQ